jgi:hypothetical protein
MIRDPIEVMQSHLTSPSGWNELKESTLAFNLFGAEFASAPQMASEEYYARIIGKLCVAVKTSVDDKCIVLDYSNLNPNSVLEIGSVMGLGGPVDLQAFEQVFAVHGKYPGQRFQPDREEKQRAVSFQTRSAADRWANEDYRALGSWSSGAE